MRRLGLAIGSALVTTALVASVAFAAPIDGGLDVQLWPGAEPGASLIVVSGTIAPDASLPATIALPVPGEGAVLWSGEVLGGDPNEDPAREPKVLQVNGGRAAEFRLEQSREAQLEVRGQPLTTEGDVISATMTYVQSVPSTTTVFSLRIPAGATDVKIVPAPLGEPQRNSVGETLYALPPQRLDPGDTLTVTAFYRLSAASAQGAAAGTGASGVLPVLIGLLVLAVVALLVVVNRQRVAGDGYITEEDT